MNRTLGRALVLLLVTHAALADTRAVTCDGCTSEQKSQSAVQATREGTVYVFDRSTGTTDKYAVFTEYLDGSPQTSWTQAVKQTAEWGIRRSFRNFMEARNAVEVEGTFVLPANFPVRSVAGAFLDPAYSSTEIEDHLQTLSVFVQLRDRVNALFAKALQANFGVIDIKDLIGTLVYTIEFPDGSYQDYEMSFSLNPISGEVRMELDAHGNAHTADGRAAPRNRSSFRGRTFHDNGGSLIEWISWARALGLVVSGNGSFMECFVDGTEIFCRVTQGN